MSVSTLFYKWDQFQGYKITSDEITILISETLNNEIKFLEFIFKILINHIFNSFFSNLKTNQKGFNFQESKHIVPQSHPNVLSFSMTDIISEQPKIILPQKISTQYFLPYQQLMMLLMSVSKLQSRKNY